MDESTRLRMRRGHTKHKDYCSCGKIVCGNGGRASHRAMHERLGDGHRPMIEDAWKAMMEAKLPGFAAEVNALARAWADKVNAEYAAGKRLFGTKPIDYPARMLAVYQRRGLTPRQTFAEILSNRD